MDSTCGRSATDVASQARPATLRTAHLILHAARALRPQPSGSAAAAAAAVVPLGTICSTGTPAPHAIPSAPGRRCEPPGRRRTATTCTSPSHLAGTRCPRGGSASRRRMHTYMQRRRSGCPARPRVAFHTLCTALRSSPAGAAVCCGIRPARRLAADGADAHRATVSSTRLACWPGAEASLTPRRHPAARRPPHLLEEHCVDDGKCEVSRNEMADRSQ